MLARGVMGNPWLISRTLKYLETGIIPPPPSTEEILNLAIRHLRMVEAHPHTRIEEMRKHLSWYTKGLKGSAEARRLINTAKTCDEMENILKGFLV
jgi:tRNA-dihydrouridine synthase